MSVQRVTGTATGPDNVIADGVEYRITNRARRQSWPPLRRGERVTFTPGTSHHGPFAEAISRLTGASAAPACIWARARRCCALVLAKA